MNSKIIRAETKLTKSLIRAGVTPQGQAWLEHVLDPFKDLPVPCAGYPDTDCGASVVQIIKQSKTIATPAGLAGANWDCNIFMDSVATDLPLALTDYTFNGVVRRDTQAVQTFHNGGAVIRSGASGAALPMDKTVDNLSLDPNYYASTETRVIAMAFEVHNTTAEIYRQGQVCYYRCPAENTKNFITTCTEDSGTTACIPASYMTSYMETPPQTLTEAVLLPGAQQTEAEKGAYVVSVMSENENKATAALPMAFMRVEEDGKVYYPSITSVGAGKLINMVGYSQQEIPYCISGAYFAGLSPQTTLTVNTVFIVERFVNATGDNNLITLANPSAPYDPAALEMYSEVAKGLACGVPVRENGLGDWISGIASTIAKYAGPVLTGVGNAINNVNERDRREENPQLYAAQQQQQIPLPPIPRVEVIKTKKIKKEKTKKEPEIREVIVYRNPPVNNPPRHIQPQQQQQHQFNQQLRQMQQRIPLPSIPGRNHSDNRSQMQPYNTNTWQTFASQPGNRRPRR